MNEEKFVCPKCGTVCEPTAQQQQTASASAAKPEEREYDRRGVLLPRRARVGGIITPQ